MHTGPLGVLGWLMGAIIWELVSHGVWGGSTEERIQRLWEQIDLGYEVQNSRGRLGMLKLSMISTGTPLIHVSQARLASA